MLQRQLAGSRIDCHAADWIAYDFRRRTGMFVMVMMVGHWRFLDYSEPP